VPELKEKPSILKNTIAGSRILKITITWAWARRSINDKKVMDAAPADMAKIRGQKPAVTKAKKFGRQSRSATGQGIG